MERTVHDNGAGPDTIDQIVFGDEFARRSGENFNDLKGASTKRRRRSEHPKFPVRKVDLALA